MKRTWKYLVAGWLGASMASSAMPLAAEAFNDPTYATYQQTAASGQASEHEPAIDPISRGRQYYEQGQFALAIEFWQTAVKDSIKRGDVLTGAIAHSYLSSAYQALNQWDEAQQSIDASAELLESYTAGAIDPMLQAQVINTKAGLAYQLGQAEAAMELWQQAEGFYRRAKDDSGVLGAQINQAQALQNLGFYRRSRQQLEKIAQQLSNLPDSELKVNGLRTLGTALQVLGDLSGSRAALFESANIAIAINRPLQE